MNEQSEQNEPTPPPEYDTLKEARKRAQNRTRPSALVTHGQQPERW